MSAAGPTPQDVALADLLQQASAYAERQWSWDGAVEAVTPDPTLREQMHDAIADHDGRVADAIAHLRGEMV